MESSTVPLSPLHSHSLGGTASANEASSSGVSWAAVIAGAFVAAALALILLALGAGLGLSSVSPWSNRGASASTLGVAAIVWLIVAQVLSAAMGGYLAGRLRTRWTSIHTDEVYFRDTAHGLLVWAVGAVLTAGVLGSAATSMAGGAARLGEATLSGGGARDMGGESLDPTAYAVDGLLRSDRPDPQRSAADVRGEVGRLLAQALRNGEMSAPDRAALASLISARTGLSQAEADQRITKITVDTKAALDTARKSAAYLSLWIFVALLSGAFCASFAATIGGRQRDHVHGV